MKQLCRRHGIPTAEAQIFEDVEKARACVRGQPGPLVGTAEGLAAGKGVIVTDSCDEALAAVDLIMVERAFGADRRASLRTDTLYSDSTEKTS